MQGLFSFDRSGNGATRMPVAAGAESPIRRLGRQNEGTDHVEIQKNSVDGDGSGEVIIRIITDAKEMESLGPQWSGLLAESYSDVVSLTHEWIMTWWNNFGRHHLLHLIAVYDSDMKLIGIAPFMKVGCLYRGVHAQKITFMANGHSPSADVITRRHDAERVIGAIFRYLKGTSGWDIIEFAKLPLEGHTCAVLLNHLESKKTYFGTKANIESPYVAIDGEWETFLNGKSQKFRKTLRNKINRAHKSGDVSIERISIRGDGEAVLQEMFSVSERSWKKKMGTDIPSNPHSTSFYRELCDRLGPRNMVHLYLLRKAAEPIAFEFHLTYNNTAFPIRADYAEPFGHLSPGSVLEAHILKTLFGEHQVKEYNTCGHTYEYLLNWSSGTRKHVNIEVFNRKFKPAGLWALEYKVIPVLRKMGFGRLRRLFLWRRNDGTHK